MNSEIEIIRTASYSYSLNWGVVITALLGIGALALLISLLVFRKK